MLTGKELISISNKSKFASDKLISIKSLSDKSKANPLTSRNRITSIFIAFENSYSISVLRFKISGNFGVVKPPE